MDLHFDVDASEFQERKRRRISNMDTAPAPTPKVPPISAPAVHEIATFLPGRLKFEHELDNEAEDLVKDLEFDTVVNRFQSTIPPLQPCGFCGSDERTIKIEPYANTSSCHYAHSSLNYESAKQPPKPSSRVNIPANCPFCSSSDGSPRSIQRNCVRDSKPPR